MDLLTPLVGKDTGKPVFVPALNAPAQALEVLMEESSDALAEARAALMMQGKGWTDRFNRAVKKIARDYPALGALATTWTGTNGFG